MLVGNLDWSAGTAITLDVPSPICALKPERYHPAHPIADNRSLAWKSWRGVARERIEPPTRTIRFWFCRRPYPAATEHNRLSVLLP